MSNSKKQTVRVGQYLLAKDGKTKYLKLGCKDDAPAEQKEVVQRLIEAIGGDCIFVNIFDQDFKDKYNIQEFVKGSISVELNSSPAPAKAEAKPAPKAAPKKSSNDNDEVDF